MSDIVLQQQVENDNKIDTKIQRSTNNNVQLYKYFSYVVMIVILMYMCFYACTCFNSNKNQKFPESYINGSPRDDTQFSNSFDVEYEVKKLINMQEKILEQLQKSRRGN
jgi:hypothetical protein